MSLKNESREETLEVLLSTMNQVDCSILNKMNIDSDVVVVNQCEEDGYREFYFKGHRIKWIDSKQRGLSRSRNLALSNAIADICILSDDDVVFKTGYKEKILDEFKTHKEDIIRFQVEGIERTFKKYPQKEQTIGFLSSMCISSVEIAFRRKSITDLKISFDERLGSGSEFFMGEENAFLFCCLKNKLTIKYLPIAVSDLHIGKSTWFKGYNKDYFISRGGAFTGMSKRFSNLLILQFAIRKYKIYKTEMKFRNAFMYMRYGRRKYLQSISGE